MRENDLIPMAISNIDAWFDTMRNKRGYCGPVSHWWQNSFIYTDAGLDWRYEGIIIGYLNLYEKTGEENWLKKAKHAGRDLIKGQLKNGNFINSSFEQNPKIGGTPHEAAADIGLLRLSKVLKENKDNQWKAYFESAFKNVKEYYIGKLWDDEEKSFKDNIFSKSYVPNKNATLCEALFLLAELEDRDEYTERYAIPTAKNIVRHQIIDVGIPVYGAIYQISTKDKFVDIVPKFFPFYTARCIPALVQAYKTTEDESYIDSAKIAAEFVIKNRSGNSFNQLVYGDGRIVRSPHWIAGIGDILRALALMKDFGTEFQLDSSFQYMLSGQDACGGFRTAYGFAVQPSSNEYGGLPDFRDVLHVCGWNDKTFRYLTEILAPDSEIPKPSVEETIEKCIFREKEYTFKENKSVVELEESESKRMIYKWKKGEPFANMNARYILR